MHIVTGSVVAVEPVEVVEPVVVEPPKVIAQAVTETYEATAYTAFCDTGCIGITASGYDVSDTIYYEGYRILAADKSIPLYTIMRVTLADGTSFDGIVLDRGGAIGINRLDILVASRAEAITLGRQAVEIEVIRRGSD